MNLQELLQEHTRVKADMDQLDEEIAHTHGPASEEYRHRRATVHNRLSSVSKQIAAIRTSSPDRTILKMDASHFLGGGANDDGRGVESLMGPRQKKTLSVEYFKAFREMMFSGGHNISAALYEGSSTGGGYAVPIVVDDQIVPLAPKEMAVRRLATVIPTTSDIKIPTKTAFGTATAKAELSSFTESEPTLGQFTLSAYMAGVLQEISWELAQDVPAFQAFAVDDMILDQQMYEENLYINGTGTGQAQGMIGNVGAGVTEEPDTPGNLVTINGTLDLMGQLNAVYHPNASWLMARTTSIIIRKAQTASNLFFPAFTRIGGQDYLHGYPVEYSQFMPVAARGAAPVLFGDFRRGYVIGDRGGSGINVKVLDQPLATQGIIQLLAYRRTDGRVRRSEAIQQYNVAAS
jgi:HK97 family phage major capsid protein